METTLKIHAPGWLQALEGSKGRTEANKVCRRGLEGSTMAAWSRMD
jgi:hypothetical protein